MSHDSPWRYRCPQGHTNWEPCGDGYLCGSCSLYGTGDAHFDALVDMKRGGVEA